jgi:protein-S-isoprenylcysteine O-methyltransferase Ste14
MHVHARAGLVGRIMAWLGGGAFVASLSVFAWCYAVRFSRTGTGPAGGSAAPIAWNLGLFTVFALHHSVMARSGVKRWLTRALPAVLERSAYVWIASALFAWTCLAWQEIPGLLYRLDAPWKYGGMALQLAGVWVTLRSAGVIDVLDLAGIRQAMGWRFTPTFKVIGPYHLVRHPIYLGWVLITFGSPTMTATRLSFAIISTAYLAAAIPFEERSLVETFGDEYRRYQGRVRWRMVPWVY